MNNLLDTHWNETCVCALNLWAGGRKLSRMNEAFFWCCYFKRENKTPQQMDGNENFEGFLLDMFSVRRIYLFWACFSIYFQWIWIHDSHIAHLQHKIVFIFTQRRVQCERLWKPTLNMDVKQPSKLWNTIRCLPFSLSHVGVAIHLLCKGNRLWYKAFIRNDDRSWHVHMFSSMLCIKFDES